MSFFRCSHGRHALREVPSYLVLIQQLQRDGVCIDVLAVDGFGALHPRGAGAATQLGVQARLPCIGVGKSLSGACSLREKEVVAAMDESAALQLNVSAHCAANSTTGSVAATSCGMSCVAVRKTLASRRPVYITVNPTPPNHKPHRLPSQRSATCAASILPSLLSVVALFAPSLSQSASPTSPAEPRCVSNLSRRTLLLRQL